MIDPKLKLYRASARITLYVLAESEDDIRLEFSRFVEEELTNNGGMPDEVTIIRFTEDEKAKVPYDWLGSLPYSCDGEVHERTIGDILSDGIKASKKPDKKPKAETVKIGETKIVPSARIPQEPRKPSSDDNFPLQ